MKILKEKFEEANSLLFW